MTEPTEHEPQEPDGVIIVTVSPDGMSQTCEYADENGTVVATSRWPDLETARANYASTASAFESKVVAAGVRRMAREPEGRTHMRRRRILGLDLVVVVNRGGRPWVLARARLKKVAGGLDVGVGWRSTTLQFIAAHQRKVGAP